MSLPELPVSDTPWTWLAIYAKNYAAADDLFRRLSRELDRDPGSRGLEAHLKQVAQDRRAAYFSIRDAMAECEIARVAFEREEAGHA